MLTLYAPAKINLLLEVLGKRGDGYHEIMSIMQTVNLCDRLHFDLASDIELSCTVREMKTSDNLILKAAEAVKMRSGYTGGARITLEKVIPWEAGLGGGSSDAAATLLGLNRLWSLGMRKEELVETAATIGSDVPFFLYAGTCEVSGRGEKINMLPDARGIWYVLLKPSLLEGGGKTGRLYGLLAGHHYSDGRYCRTAVDGFLASGKIAAKSLYNTFDAVALEAYAGLEQYWKIFEKAGAQHIHLAGSGPVMFTLTYDEGFARSVYNKLKDAGIQSFFAAGISRNVIE